MYERVNFMRLLIQENRNTILIICHLCIYRKLLSELAKGKIIVIKYVFSLSDDIKTLLKICT